MVATLGKSACWVDQSGHIGPAGRAYELRSKLIFIFNVAIIGEHATLLPLSHGVGKIITNTYGVRQIADQDFICQQSNLPICHTLAKTTSHWETIWSLLSGFSCMYLDQDDGVIVIIISYELSAHKQIRGSKL